MEGELNDAVTCGLRVRQGDSDRVAAGSIKFPGPVEPNRDPVRSADVGREAIVDHLRDVDQHVWTT